MTVVCLALSGFYLSLFRESSQNIVSAIGTSINGVFIQLAFLTVKMATKSQHRQTSRMGKFVYF